MSTPSEEDFDELVNMVLSDMHTEVPGSFREAIKNAPRLCKCGLPVTEIHACI